MGMVFFPGVEYDNMCLLQDDVYRYIIHIFTLLFQNLCLHAWFYSARYKYGQDGGARRSAFRDAGGMVEWLRRFVSKSYALKPKSDIKPKVYKP